jgi:PTS system nitrogen regulatory IIA component
MELKHFLSYERIGYLLPVTSKKKGLEAIAKLIAQDLPQCSVAAIFAALMARERLGSTNAGHGIAIPHGRLDTLTDTVGALLTLKDPIDFDQADQPPVDIIFALCVPLTATTEHLQLLAQIAEKCHRQDFQNGLRQANSKEALYTFAIAS